MRPVIMPLFDPFEAALFESLTTGSDFFEGALHRAGGVDERPHIPCSPELPAGTGYHKHLCRCGTCWEHDDMLPMITSSQEFDTAHSCPSCGNQVREKHRPDRL